MITYQQVDWQEFTFVGTISGTPTDELEITTSVTGGDILANQPYQKEGDPVGTYRNRLAPHEIKTGASISVDLTSPSGSFDTPSPIIISLTDPSTISADPQYCSVYDLYLRFGSENVNKWADLNNVRNIQEITETIINQIVYSSDYVDSKIRNKKYSVPFVAPFPNQINEITRLHAGTQLHTARGIEDADGTMAGLRQRADMLMREILAGQIELEISTLTDDPGEQEPE